MEQEINPLEKALHDNEDREQRLRATTVHIDNVSASTAVSMAAADRERSKAFGYRVLAACAIPITGALFMLIIAIADHLVR